MNTKLTLKLNKRSIDRAKKYARKNKQSLSALVENYFNLIAEKDNSDKIEISPNVIELSGIDKSDYKKSKIPVLTAKEFLKAWQTKSVK